MKGILIEPGKEPVVTPLPDSLWAIENRLGTRSEMIVLPRTPAVLFVGRYDGPIQPASLLNRTYRGRQLYGPILCCYIVSEQERTNQLREDALAGLVPRCRYLSARYSLSEEEAHQWTEEAKADSQSEEQITFGGA